MSASSEDHQADKPSDWDKKESMKRLSKRLAYLLRYGAVKEGLEVDHNGYVELNDLCTANLLQKYSPAEVLESIETSVSYRNTKRYDHKKRDGVTYVRAAYLRNFERSPFHHKTNVKTLFESSMSCILNNLDDYDMEDFPDENILRTMIRRLKRERRLTNRALSVLLAPTVTRLDLEGVYLTNNTLRMVWTQCPHLTAISLKNCGYIITDNVLSQFTKRLPQIEKLNLCACSHLTNKCLTTLAKNLPRLTTLHIARVKALTPEAVLQFIQRAPALKFLDVFYLRTSQEEYSSLFEAAETKGMTLVMRKPKAEDSSETLTDNDNDNDYKWKEDENDYEEEEEYDTDYEVGDEYDEDEEAELNRGN